MFSRAVNKHSAFDGRKDRLQPIVNVKYALEPAGRCITILLEDSTQNLFFALQQT